MAESLSGFSKEMGRNALTVGFSLEYDGFSTSSFDSSIFVYNGCCLSLLAAAYDSIPKDEVEG